MEKRYYDAKYASDVMNEIPMGYWIDKTVAGCGLTTLALNDAHNAIILVPRVSLVENKVLQHKDILGVVSGVSKTDVDNYITDMAAADKPAKIMCTYNSFALGKLDRLIDGGFRIYVDESQFLLEFAQEHPELLPEFHNRLSTRVEMVSFFSARPPKVEYMPKYIREMDKMKIEWSGTITAKPYICDAYQTKAVVTKILKEINTKGSYQVADISLSKVIVFINSVTAIKTVVQKAKLDRADVGYIVGDTLRNDAMLGKLGSRITNPHKLPKFTFVTSTGLAGIDLYDEEAFTIVVSNTSKEWTMFDMELDIPQAISRQRLQTNPNFGKFLFILNRADMQDRINNLETVYEELIEFMSSSVIPSMNRDIASGMLKDDVTRQRKVEYVLSTEFVEDEFILNEPYLLALKYNFKELFEQYQKGYKIRSTTGNETAVYIEPVTASSYYEIAKEVSECNTKKELDDVLSVVDNKDWVTYLRHGWEIGKVLTNTTEARELYEFSGTLKGAISKARRHFKVGEFYAVSEVKTFLTELYNESGIERKAKGTDINELMTVKACSKRIDSKKVKGFEITSHEITK